MMGYEVFVVTPNQLSCGLEQRVNAWQEHAIIRMSSKNVFLSEFVIFALNL